MKKFLFLLFTLILLFSVTVVSAQVSYPNSTFTSYQVVNLDNQPANITVQYYDQNGNPSSYSANFRNVPPNGAVTVQQSLESGLASGQYSAVISSDRRIAAIANQQLGVSGSGGSIPPFSSYSAFSEGSTQVTLPVIMYNWYGYYTELFVQNVSSNPATNIQISYTPTTLGGCTTGKTGSETVASSSNPLPAYASRKISNFGASFLGATGGTGACATYNGRFLGMAKITADQPVAVVVNEIVQDKLFTYNGFAQAGTTLLAPAYMRNWYNYYASLTIANPSTTSTANITLTYTPGSGSNPSTVITAYKSIPAGRSITIYDGPGSTGTDLSPVYDLPNERFFGSVKITSDIPIVAMVNQESTPAAGKQSGSYNAFRQEDAGSVISVPLVQSAFYDYYTSITIMTVDGSEANIRITYTSDGTFSTVKNQSKSYTHTTVNGFLNRYEGASASPAQSDILDDPFWQSGGQRRFLGSAKIEVLSGSKIVVFVNSEYAKKASDPQRDSMYTYNAFTVNP